jgi:hypothetical protein
MAHDLNLDQTQSYIYDKIFRREVTPGQPIYDINQLVSTHGHNATILTSYPQNKRILNDIADAMHSFPKYTLQQYENHFKKTFNIRWTRYFKDFELKQTNLPLSQSLVEDLYIKLWGNPGEETYNPLSHHTMHSNFSKQKKFQSNLMTITKNIIRQYPNKTTKEYIKIIEKEYPIYAEKLLNYLVKWKHILNDTTYKNGIKNQNPWDQPRIRNKRYF